MNGPKIYLVGRENSTLKCHIYTPRREDTVSRQHLEITLTENGKIWLNDLDSAGGTFVKRNGTWERIGEGYVDRSDAVRLGEYRTTVSRLLGSVEMESEVDEEPEENERRGRAYFDPLSGRVKYE